MARECTYIIRTGTSRTHRLRLTTTRRVRLHARGLHTCTISTESAPTWQTHYLDRSHNAMSTATSTRLHHVAAKSISMPSYIGRSTNKSDLFWYKAYRPVWTIFQPVQPVQTPSGSLMAGFGHFWTVQAPLTSVLDVSRHSGSNVVFHFPRFNSNGASLHYLKLRYILRALGSGISCFD